MALIPKVKLPRVALQRSTLQTPNTPKFVKPKDGKRYIRMLGVFLTLLDKWGRPQPEKPSIHSRRPLGVHLLPWLYHGNSYRRDRANQNLPKVQERTLRHRSNEICRAVWRPHWPFMQKHLVRPQFATGFQKAPFGRRTNCVRPILLYDFDIRIFLGGSRPFDIRRSSTPLDLVVHGFLSVLHHCHRYVCIAMFAVSGQSRADWADRSRAFAIEPWQEACATKDQA